MSATIQIEASDTTLYGTDNGVEGPALLFLNGAFGSQRDWTAIADQLGNRYRSVTFDARGRGRSPGALCTHSMPTSTTSPQWSKARVWTSEFWSGGHMERLLQCAMPPPTSKWSERLS